MSIYELNSKCFIYPVVFKKIILISFMIEEFNKCKIRYIHNGTKIMPYINEYNFCLKQREYFSNNCKI